MPSHHDASCFEGRVEIARRASPALTTENNETLATNAGVSAPLRVGPCSVLKNPKNILSLGTMLKTAHLGSFVIGCEFDSKPLAPHLRSE